MTNLSDRQHDIFDNAAKMACRQGNVRVVRESAYLLWEDGNRTRLRCDWCELMGETGWLTLELLERERMLAPGGFLGIDLDAARIASFRQRRPDLKWVSGNFYERLEDTAFGNVGILNLDAYKAVGNPDAMFDFRLVAALAKQSLDQFGEFALFLNADLDAVVRQGGNPGTALRAHSDMISRVLGASLPRRQLTSEMLLPCGSEHAIESGFVGICGAFEIYRGTDRGHRMANLRVVLR